jgi:hypothetical protein
LAFAAAVQVVVANKDLKLFWLIALLSLNALLNLKHFLSE